MTRSSANTSTDAPGRVLVTGGAGFIGSHLVDLLLSHGRAVTVVDNLSTGRRENLPEFHEHLRFIEADLSDALGAFGPGERFEQIYHLAAAVGVQLVMREQIRAIETNVEETAALLRFAHRQAETGAAPGTLIASSSEVYGKSEHAPFAEDDNVTYGPTRISRWSYACSKAIDEYLAMAYHQAHALPVVIARFFNTVGPRQVGAYGMVLPRFVESALRGEPLTIYGTGDQSRCFCDVRDVVRALPRLVETRSCHGRVFNIGADSPVTIAQLADRVREVLRSSSDARRVPYSEAYPEGFEDLRQRKPDLSRIRAAVGFEPKIPLEQTILDIAGSIGGGAW